MKWTKEQGQAIKVRDKSILVSAAAGSGKTAVLVERIKQILTEEKVELDEILVVTFTNAAASEMREKIVGAIPGQMDMIQKSQIGTFHSFALDVIGRYFHLIDLEPGFRVCDEPRKILLENEAMDQLLEERFESDDPDFIRFLKMYGTSKSEDRVREMIGTVYNFIMSMPNPFEWLDESVKALDISLEEFLASPIYKELMDQVHKTVDGALVNLSKVEDLLSANSIASLESKAEIDRALVENIKRAFQEDFEMGRELLAARTFERFTVKKDDKEAYALIKDQVGLLRDRAKGQLKDLQQKYVKASLETYLEEIRETKEAGEILQGLVHDFHRIFTEKKRSKGLIDFSDIEHFALEILAREEAASEYRNKFEYIFIDEYQDSNLVQEALIQRIQRPDNVFMVGDVKQSIYKFRLAEPEIFIDKYNDFRQELDPCGMKIDLNKNFRSKGPILDGVNALFYYLMCKETAGMDYDEEAALYKGLDYQGPLDHKPEFYLIDYEKEDPEDLTRVESEAMLVASLIEKNRGLAYFDVKSNSEKKLDYKDMVVLLRSAARDGEKYKEALELYGIPAFIDAGDGYYDSLEISVFINLLKIIDNKYQDIPLLSILRSAIFNFDMEDMAAVRGNSPATSYMQALEVYGDQGPDPVLKEKCKLVLEKISGWKKLRRHMPLKDFVWELMLGTDFYYYVGALPGGGQRQANLRALADKALAYENSQAKGLFGFINYIEAVKEKKIATAPVNLLGEGDNVVRIMTVHKSKGLEYPFVVLAGLGKQFVNEKGKQTSLHKQMGLAIRQVDKDLTHYRKTLLQKLIDNKISTEALAEEIRILYVAMTRAQDKLILVGSARNADKLRDKALLLGRSGIETSASYLEMILPVYGSYQTGQAGQELVDFHMVQSSSIVTGRDIEERLTQTEFDQDPGLAKYVADRFQWKYSFEETTKNKAKYSVSELTRQAREKDRMPVGSKVDTEAMDRGNAYHTIIEHLPLGSSFSQLEEIDEFIESLVEDNIISQEDQALVDNKKILGFARSDIFKRMQEADELYREMPFVLVREEAGEEIIIQGIIDAYFKEDGAYVLVDFKSDRDDGSPERAQALIENYRPQIDMYREALEKLGSHKVKEAYLHILTSNRILKVD